jgi:hypothetical protein
MDGNRVFIDLPRNEYFNASRAVYLKRAYRELKLSRPARGAVFNRTCSQRI